MKPDQMKNNMYIFLSFWFFRKHTYWTQMLNTIVLLNMHWAYTLGVIAWPVNLNSLMYFSQAAVGESTGVTGKLEQAGHPKGLTGLPAVLINCASQAGRMQAPFTNSETQDAFNNKKHMPNNRKCHFSRNIWVWCCSKNLWGMRGNFELCLHLTKVGRIQTVLKTVL